MAKRGALAAFALAGVALFACGLEAGPRPGAPATTTPTSARTAGVPAAPVPPTPVLVTVVATPTAIATLTPSQPAPAPTAVKGPPAPSTASWPQFTDGRIGVAFRYPPACPPQYNQSAIEIGPRIALDARETHAPTLDAYLDELLRSQDWRVETRVPGTLGEQPTIRLEYRFGGTNRFGVAYLVHREGFVYVWQFTTGGGTTECELPATFDAVLGTFRLVDIRR